MVVSGFGMVIQFFHFVPFIAIVIVALVSESATAAWPNTFSITSHFAVNMKIMTRTLQTEANGKFGKEKVKKTVIFLDKTFF